MSEISFIPLKGLEYQIRRPLSCHDL